MLNCLAEHVLHSMLVGDIALDDEDLVWVSAHLLRDEQLLEPPREERERPSRFRERDRALLADTCVHLRLSCDREGRPGWNAPDEAPVMMATLTSVMTVPFVELQDFEWADC